MDICTCRSDSLYCTPQTLQTINQLCVVSRSVVSHSVTPWTVSYQVPLSMGILQARILLWVAMPSSRGSAQPRDQTQIICLFHEFHHYSICHDIFIYLLMCYILSSCRFFKTGSLRPHNSECLFYNFLLAYPIHLILVDTCSIAFRD